MPIRRETWWDKRTNLEKCLIRFHAVFVVFVILFLIVLAASKFKNCENSHAIANTNVCTTKGCIKSAADLLNNMDLNINPCDDFYGFACGNYIKAAKIPHDKTYVNTFTAINDLVQDQLRTALEEPIREEESKPFRNAKKYYRACINRVLTERIGLDMVKELLGNLGGWPVLEGEFWNEHTFDWKRTMYNFRRTGLNVDTLFDLSVGFDLKNSNRRIIQIDQPSLGISREYLINGFKDKITKAYLDHMIDVAVVFGADPDQAATELKESLEFEMKLANYSLSQEERRNITSLYNIMTIGELDSRFSSYEWLDYINSIFLQVEHVAARDVILLGVPKFIVNLEQLLKITPRRVVANYLMWRTVKNLIPYLNDKLQDLHLKFIHVMNGIEEIAPRWRVCVEEAEKSLPIIVGALYVRKYFKQDAKRSAVELVQFVKEAFKTLLRDLDWMEENTKKSALEKANSIVDHIAYPDELLDDRKLEAIFQTLEVHEEQFMYSMLNISIFTTDLSFKRLRLPVNKTDWMDHSSTAQVNAFYHPMENSIIFPAGILQGVLFNNERPNYLNYGSIGSVIGHEITHGFDDTGRLFDKNGNLMDWWEPRTQTAFLEKAQCIIEQYGNFTVTEINLKLNGVKTQGENIADNGGLKEAYLAYKSWVQANQTEEYLLPGLDYSASQLFWISAAQNWCSKHRSEAVELQVTTDVHAPEEFRVLGPFSNLDYFARDFNCPLGTKMNPSKKCTVW